MSDDAISETFILEIKEEHHQHFKRLDQLLSQELNEISRTGIKSLFAKGLIQLHENSPIKNRLELKKLPPLKTIVEVLIPAPLDCEAKAQDIPLNVLYEDEHLIFIVKPAGLVTHPAPGHPDHTLVNAILFLCPDLQGIGDQRRPGIVHRLDKGTSGIMVVAKTQKCHEGLVQLFATHDIERRYQCLCLSKGVSASGTLESTIGRHPQHRKKMAAHVRGKQAITHYKILESFLKVQHLEMTLETGRTHQIRVHTSSLLKAPILMDELYASPKNQLDMLSLPLRTLLKNYSYPLLHAKVLGLKHPITGIDLRFEVEPSETFIRALEILRNENNI